MIKNRNVYKTKKHKDIMDKKQKVIVILLIVAILLSFTSIVITLSSGSSPIDFRYIKGNPSPSGASVGITINEPVGVADGN